MASRKSFIQAASLMLTASATYPLTGRAAILGPGENFKTNVLQMGMAGFTFQHFTVEQCISMMQRVGIDSLSIKDFHLPLNSTQDKINEVLGKFRSGGISIYAVGVIYMKNAAEVDLAFDYAKKVGVNLIVGVPEYDLLTYTEEKVRSTGIKIAIHNHGPEDKRYPGPKDIYDRIKNMDARVGICLDIGHAVRAGADPAKAILDYRQRIFDLHIKDVTLAAEHGKAIEVGRGIINFPPLVKALKKISFQGKCSIEFEKDMKDPLPGIAESAGFFRGVMTV